MSKKSSQAPDPYATAAAQTTANQQTANYNADLNRVDQYTPYGSSVYSVTGTSASGAPQYRQDVTLTPMAQQELDNEQRQDAALSNIGFGLADKANASLAQGVSTAGLPALQGGGTPGQVQTSISGVPGVTSAVGDAGGIAGSIAGAGRVTSSIAGAGNIQNDLNYRGLQALPNASDFNGAATAARDASYAQATSRLDPQWKNNQSDLDAKLANQGIVQGSEAYQRAEDELGRQKTDAYNQANYSAQAAGLAAQQQGYSQALSTRQQGANEVTTAGNFANQAQQQGFGQQQDRATFANTAQQQRFSQNQAQATFSNAAQQQLYSQLLSSGAFANSAQAQAFQQALSSGQFANEAEAQQYAQYLQGAAANNAARAQGLQEQTTLASLPLNQLNALRSGTQITNPSFTSVPQSQAAGTDVSGNVYKSYQLQTANDNSFMNGLFSLGGAALSAAK